MIKVSFCPVLLALPAVGAAHSMLCIAKRNSRSASFMQNTALVTPVFKTLNITFLVNSKGLWRLYVGLPSFWTGSSSCIQRRTRNFGKWLSYNHGLERVERLLYSRVQQMEFIAVPVFYFCMNVKLLSFTSRRCRFTHIQTGHNII
jgi:hypothetical protein